MAAIRKLNLSATRSRQRGAAFVVSMILLLVLTLMGITAMRLGNSQLLISNSFENENEAFVNAENALRAGQRDLMQNFEGAPAFSFEQSGDGYYGPGTIVVDSPDWDGMSYESGGTGVQYIIEYIGPAPAVQGSLALGAGTATSMQFVYRIVGRGSSSKGAVRLTETIFTSTE